MPSIGANLRIKSGVGGIGQATAGVAPAPVTTGMAAFGMDPSTPAFWAFAFFVGAMLYILGAYFAFGGLRGAVL